MTHEYPVICNVKKLDEEIELYNVYSGGLQANLPEMMKAKSIKKVFDKNGSDLMNVPLRGMKFFFLLLHA